MARTIHTGGHLQGLFTTHRNDRWWVEPAWTGLGFAAFVAYSTWAAFQGAHYWVDSYLSPFYSPLLYIDPSVPGSAPVEHAWFGVWPDSLKAIWPSWLPISPAFLILAGPLAFRGTCYYYRKFYYRAYFSSPPGCGVGGARKGKYRGETALFLFQNLHRYTLYIAIAYIGILYYDAYHAFFRDGKFGAGVGSLILLLNPTLLAFYTLGCHSFRHLIGGRLNCFSCDAVAQSSHGAWSGATKLNRNHMRWAWISLVWVGFTDFYVRMVSMGSWTDFNTWS
ncbi:MAG TPA: succinate dehydrogenase [Planctomycetes bacterium]|nr:succinate dehydrogenase [Planctomycetota bacterium]|tara:strand:+ start:237 stop:1073 length:837 start_codon:yes stop_codon:yes gene_type:complete